MKEGEAIEHNLLSSAIRRAQKRVEGRNFEIRKRLLDYDLVLARQREAVYSLRDRFLLPSRDGGLQEGAEADLDAYLHDLFEEFVEGLVAAHAGKDRAADERDLTGLARELSAFLPIDASALEGLTSPDLVSRSVEHLDQALAEQRRRLGAPFPLLSRYLILTSLDEAWRTHLYTLDDLKGGIGWTAYGGTDPLVAFKRESFVLFQEMLGQTAEKIVRILLNPRLTIATEAAPEPRQAPARELQYSRPDTTFTQPPANAPQAETPGAHRPVRVIAQPGRNDPCPCGSGKKYKKCCGAGR